MKLPNFKSLPAEMMMGLVRHLMTALGIWLMSQGAIVDGDREKFELGSTQVIGGLVMLSSVAWSQKRKIDRAKPAVRADGDFRP